MFSTHTAICDKYLYSWFKFSTVDTEHNRNLTIRSKETYLYILLPSSPTSSRTTSSLCRCSNGRSLTSLSLFWHVSNLTESVDHNKCKGDDVHPLHTRNIRVSSKKFQYILKAFQDSQLSQHEWHLQVYASKGRNTKSHPRVR